jgi:hypothetical protein
MRGHCRAGANRHSRHLSRIEQGGFDMYKRGGGKNFSETTIKSARVVNRIGRAPNYLSSQSKFECSNFEFECCQFSMSKNAAVSSSNVKKRGTHRLECQETWQLSRWYLWAFLPFRTGPTTCAFVPTSPRGGIIAMLTKASALKRSHKHFAGADSTMAKLLQARPASRDPPTV